MHYDMVWIMSREETLSNQFLAFAISYIEEKIPRYDVLQETKKTYQGPWCQYEDMEPTPEVSDIVALSFAEDQESGETELDGSV